MIKIICNCGLDMQFYFEGFGMTCYTCKKAKTIDTKTKKPLKTKYVKRGA